MYLTVWEQSVRRNLRQIQERLDLKIATIPRPAAIFQNDAWEAGFA